MAKRDGQSNGDLLDHAEEGKKAPRRGGKSRSKAEMYGVANDARGEFMVLPKGVIHVDDAYQRDERTSTVREVANNLSWAAFGTLSVARRQGQDGPEYFVVDGQHRLLGVKRRDDVKDVPCMVFDVNTIEDEATAFLRANTQRRPVTALEKHKAKAVRKDHTAMVLEELIGQAGLKLSASATPGTVRCVNLIEGLLTQDEQLFRKVWPIVVEVCQGKPIHERIVHGLFYIAQQTEGEIFKVFWRRRIVAVGYDDLLKAATQAAAFYARGGVKVWASGMVQVLNKGMRHNRLKMHNDESDMAA